MIEEEYRLNVDQYRGSNPRELKRIEQQRREKPVLKSFLKTSRASGEVRKLSYSSIATETGLDELIVESLLPLAGGGNGGITIGEFREMPSVLVSQVRSDQTMTDSEERMRFPVWRLMSHHSCPDEADSYFAAKARIAIGWGDVGDVRRNALTTSAQVADAIRRTYPNLNNAGAGGVCLHNFCFRMRRGDLVIISCAGRRTRVVEVDTDYVYCPDPEPAPIGNYQHQRDAKPVEIHPRALWLEAGARPKPQHNRRWSLIEAAAPITGATLARLARNV